jgi:dTDP-4-dehydrorhamnose reductase
MGKLNVLILGDGLLGSEIVKQSRWDYISRSNGTFNIDNIPLSLDNYLPDIIVNCIANTDTYSTDKEAHWRVNCQYLSDLIDYCNRNFIKLVHISTDYIYAGSINNASEEDVPVHCNNWYGYTKLIGDGIVQLQSNEYLLVRCTHKPTPFPYENAWIDQIGNFDYVNIIAEFIITLINKEAVGVYNVGSEVKTMYELALITKPVGKSLTPPNVPKNQSMNITKMLQFLG